MGSGLCSGDPTRYYRANKHAVCPPLSPLDTVGITYPPPLPSLAPSYLLLLPPPASRFICSIRRPPAVFAVASLLTPVRYIRFQVGPLSRRCVDEFDRCNAIVVLPPPPPVSLRCPRPRCRVGERESGTLFRACVC